MVRFIDGSNDNEEDSSRWEGIMEKTRERFREIWSGGENIPERD